MKTVFRISGIFLFVFLIHSCKKENDNTIRDSEGNSYKIVTIGSQTWMAENLKTTKFKYGTDIPLVTDGATWLALTTPGYCWYNNDADTYKSEYGALYNWYTISTGNLCPKGWHVPGDAEWTTLTNYLGGDDEAGGKLKETSTAHWLSPNTGATNVSGFTAIPAGYRYNYGLFFSIGYSGHWWSATEYGYTMAKYFYLYFDFSYSVRDNNFKKIGYSVRCLKDE